MDMGTVICAKGKMSWVIFILTIFHTGVTSYAQSITLVKDIVLPVKGSSFGMSCTLSMAFTSSVISLLKNGSSLVSCYGSNYVCSLNQGYTFKANQTGVFMTISSLDRGSHEGRWTCTYAVGTTNITSNLLNLVVHTLPAGIRVTQEPSENVDLSMTSATFQCSTIGCSYPDPVIQWMYEDQFKATGIQTGASNSCIYPEKIYTSTLFIQRNSILNNNIDKTVMLSCSIDFPAPFISISAKATKSVRFAVRVTEVVLQQNNQNITDTLTVNLGEPVALTCITGYGRPDSTIDWYIGSQRRGSGRELNFTPSFFDHNQLIYCQAYNTDPNRIVYSLKPRLSVQGIVVITPKVPEINQTATVSGFIPAPRLWHLPPGSVLCSDVVCDPDAYGSYIFRADPNKTEFIFQSLNRSRDERVWACQHGDTNYSINLQIYTIPRGINLIQTPDMNVDLGMMSVTIQCRTTSCTYPEPSIEWLYQDQTTSNTYVIYTRTIPSFTQGPCILPEKIYTGSISISQNTTWSDNSDKTVTFLCRIGYSDPSKNITSLASKPVSFAVRVIEAILQHNNQLISSTLTVTSGEQVTLTCVTGTSRPAPVIDWYIGSRSMGSGTNLIFTPSNLDHNNVIYCQAYNIDPNLKVDSNKPSLFVRVRFTEAFLQQNNQNISSTLTVTSGEQVTLTCVTGTSRPAPSIDWYIGSRLMGSGTNLIFTPSNTDHNEVIYCQAYNIDPNLKVDSNKPSLFVRVNVSSVTLDGSAGGTVVFTEGYPQTLKCINSPSRPMPMIRWLLGNKQVTYNITNSDIMDTDGLHVLTSEITLVLMRNSSNQKVYCEGFISGQGTIVMSTQVNVDVQYAPDVKVNISGSTVVGSTAVLMCVPQGNPSSYIFHPWIHMVGQTEIRRLAGVNTFGFSTLPLSSISIQDMGTYICTVDNSITGLNGQINQKGDTDMYVQGLPVIGETKSTFIGDTNNSARIEIPFYSFSSVKTVKFIKRLNSSEISNASDISFYALPSKITMLFYKISVTIPGHVAVLYFRNLKDTDFDNYTLEVSNQWGTVLMQFDLIALAPPTMPKRFAFIHIEDGFLVFIIEKGFNGGHEQTFIVEYQPFGLPDTAWSTIFKINETDLDDPFTNGTSFIKIPKIQDGQYIFRVYAENKKGNTSTIEALHVVEIKTDLPSVMNDVPVGAVVGGVVGAIVVVTVIVAVVFAAKRWNLRPEMEGNMTKVTHGSKGPEYINTAFRSDINTTEYEALQSDRTGSSQYEALNDPKAKLNQLADISISSDPRPSAGEMFYDKLQPCDTNQGHMYTSLSSPRLDDGENKFYENTAIVNETHP